MLWRKMLPVAALGALGVGYILARPALAAAIPNLTIVEYPVGLALVATLLGLALRKPPELREVPAPEWHRHEQVVRELPDPAARPLADALERYLETGEGAPAAADALARAHTADTRVRDEMREKLAMTLTAAARGPRRKREAILKEHLRPNAPGA